MLKALTSLFVIVFPLQCLGASFTHHPDGYVVIQDDSGNRVQYLLSDFKIDEPGYEPLPNGAIGRKYVQGKRRAAFGKDRLIPEAKEWPDGDAYISRIAAYQAAQAQREAARSSVPGDPKQEAIQFLRSTDWMAIRALEGGKPLPGPVQAARARARAKLIVEPSIPIPDRDWETTE